MHFMISNSKDFFTKIYTFWQMKKCCSKSAKKHHYFRFLAEQFLFKLLLFLNGLSYKYQIGLKLKLIYNSFKKYKQQNFSSMVYHIKHKKIGFLAKIFVKSWFTVHKSIWNTKLAFQFKLSQKLLQNTFHLRPIWYL